MKILRSASSSSDEKALGLADAARERELPPDPPPSDLRKLVEAYERSVILSALGAMGGRQRRAATLLGVRPSTLNEKMKRLGIRAQRADARGLPVSRDEQATLEWRGAIHPGGTLELRGLNGPVRVEAGSDQEVEVKAVRRGDRHAFSAIEVKILEHARGVTVCAVSQWLPQGAPPRLFRRLSRVGASARVDLVARVPPGLHVVASTVNDDIEVVGLNANVETETANGRVRFLPATSPPTVPAPPEP